MNFLVFWITYPIIWLLSILPMRLLYILSDFLFFIIYSVFGYRKKVILENITYAFPEKSEKQRLIILKKFYKHFTDIIVESIKAFTITEKFILKRYKFNNPELVNQFLKDGRSVALVGAHLANWEWSISLPIAIEGNVFGTYNKLRNEIFEKKLLQSRKKFGISGSRTSDFMKFIKNKYDNNIQGSYVMLSDQSPMLEKTFYWGDFFGIKVPIHTGAEMLAKNYNLVVINYRAKKIKRGYFEVDFELITENPRDFEDYKITDKFLRITEQNVREQPECYLWSHKRFKHKDSYNEWKKMFEARKNK